MNPPDPSLERVRTKAQRLQAEFVKNELQSGLTYAAVAKTEYSIGDAAGGDRARELAGKAYAEALSRLSQIEWEDDDKQWVEERCRELSNALDGLRRKYLSPAFSDRSR